MVCITFTHPLALKQADWSRRYTIKELQSDIEKQLLAVEDPTERERLREFTKLGVFVVHNKYVSLVLDLLCSHRSPRVPTEDQS